MVTPSTAPDHGGHQPGHKDVAKVSFTGSTATGKKVLEAGASALRRITLELGGNDAAIVLEGVDPREVAPKVFKAAMINSGQVCLAAKRLYVPESLYEAFCEELAALANDTVIGDGMQQGTQYGPLQIKAQYEKVKACIEEAGRDGIIIAGGEHPGRGYFVRPTIVRDIADDARLVREEQFGPVLPVAFTTASATCWPRCSSPNSSERSWIVTKAGRCSTKNCPSAAT